MLGFILHLIKIMPISDGMIYGIAPLAVMGIAAGAQALFGGIQAIGGAAERKRLAGQEPKYQIPKEATEAIGLAKSMAQEGIPSAQRMAALQNIQQSAVMGQRAAADRRGGLMAVGTSQAQMDRSLLNLAAQDADALQHPEQLD